MDRHHDTLSGTASKPTRQQVADREAAMDQAVTILAVHVPDPDDRTCTGCLLLWDRWIPYDACPQVTWARTVVETHAALTAQPVEAQTS